MGHDRAPAYWAVIPAKVRYDRELRPNAKLLYAEITAMADATGYCWATNEYLGQLFGIGIRAVQKLVASLAAKGYIVVEVVRDAQTNEVKERRLWVDKPAPEIIEEEGAPSGTEVHDPSRTEVHDPSRTEVHDPSRTKVHVEQSKVNLIYPPIVPQGDEGVKAPSAIIPRRRRPLKTVPLHKPDRFDAFWSVYPRHEDRAKAVRAWDRLSPDDELLEQMSRGLKRQLESELWQRGFGIPYAATWLNGARWEDVPFERGTAEEPEGRQWADDPEVI